MKLLFDLEGNDLLPNLHTLWCGGAINIETGEEYLFSPDHMSLLDFQQLLCRAEEVIAHNALGYDIPAMEKVGYLVSGPKVTDTLVLSKLVYPDLSERDFTQKNSPVPAKLLGRHSLEAWGYRLGMRKTSYDDFTQYTPEMLEYCMNDCRLLLQLYLKLRDRAPQGAIDLEHRIRRVCYEQTANGFPFDHSKAQLLDSKLSARRSELKQEMRDTFPPTVIQLKTKAKVIPFNPGSRTQIADRLMALGWKPTEFTETGQPKIDDDILDGIKDIPEAAKLAELFMVQKRISQLSEGKQGWIKRAVNGRIHGEIDTLGTGTFRCSHSNPNMGQVPSCSAPYGKECRELFHAPEGWKLMGCDVSRLELMVLAHYMNDEKFTEVMLSGDVHQLLADVYGTNRNTGKTVTYAFLYGAGMEKLGSIVDPTGTKQAKIAAGKKIHKNMQARLPALSNLIAGIKKAADSRQYLWALDRRKLPVRSSHSALNFLCQSAGAIICKQWVVNFHESLRNRGYLNGVHYMQVAFVHDEVQVLCREGYEEEIGQLCVAAIAKAGEDLGLRLPITGEYKCGKSWSDTH